MPGRDIRQFFRPSNRVSSPQRAQKRPFELPMEKPFLGFFHLGKPVSAKEPMIGNKRSKRLKQSAVQPQFKVRTKLEIMQWHFSQQVPNCVITANKFFPDKPSKVRTVQN